MYISAVRIPYPGEIITVDDFAMRLNLLVVLVSTTTCNMHAVRNFRVDITSLLLAHNCLFKPVRVIDYSLCSIQEYLDDWDNSYEFSLYLSVLIICDRPKKPADSGNDHDEEDNFISRMGIMAGVKPPPLASEPTTPTTGYGIHIKHAVCHTHARTHTQHYE